MKPLRSLFVFASLMLLSMPCFAQYEAYYIVGNDSYVTTKRNAKLFKLHEGYKSDLFYGNTASSSSTRDLIDTINCKVRKVRKPQQLKVLRYTNLSKEVAFNGYIVEFKDNVWVLHSRDVADNASIIKRSSIMLEDRESLEQKRQALANKVDMLNGQVDSLTAHYNEMIDKYTTLCADSLQYYKTLTDQLPDLRTSLINEATQKEQARLNNLYDEWFNSQPETTKKALTEFEITESTLSAPNYAGGCDYTLSYINKSSKIIKYLYWTGTAYNRVNDPAECDIKGTATFIGQEVGPVEANAQGGGVWGSILYNRAAESMKLSKINIVYMDDTTLDIDSEDIERALNAPSTEVKIDEEAVCSVLPSYAECHDLISTWIRRSSRVTNKDFKFSSFNTKDTEYDNVWLTFHNMEREKEELIEQSKEVQTEVENKQKEIEKFDNFLNFNMTQKGEVSATQPYVGAASINTPAESVGNTIMKKNPFVTVGIEGVVEGMFSFSTGGGVNLRIGRFNSIFNGTIGVKYQYTSYSQSIYFSQDSNTTNAIGKSRANQLVIPVTFNWNVYRGNTTSLYYGVGYEFGVLLSHKLNFETPNGILNEQEFYNYYSSSSKVMHLAVPTRALTVHIGASGRHWDWKVFYKFNLYHSNKYKIDPGTIGTSASFYF